MKRYIMIGAVAVLGFSIFSGTAFAKKTPSAVNPTSDLYSTTRVMENVSFNLTNNVADKAILQEEFANKRLIEIELALKNGDKKTAFKLINDYNVSITAVNELMKKANKEKSTKDLLKSVSIITPELLKKNTQLLKNMMKNYALPSEAIHGIQQAINNQKVVYKPIYAAINKAEKEKAKQKEKDDQNNSTETNTTADATVNGTADSTDSAGDSSSWSSSTDSTPSWESSSPTSTSSESNANPSQSTSETKTTSDSQHNDKPSSSAKDSSKDNQDSTPSNSQGQSKENTSDKKTDTSSKDSSSDDSGKTSDNAQGDQSNKDQNNQEDGGPSYWCGGVLSSTPFCSNK